MRMFKIFILLPILLMMISCVFKGEESPTLGLSTPSINEDGETMTNIYQEEIFSDGELENKIIEYSEKYRPQYHYSPKKNWVNDPNGLVYFEGVWHLYYQHNPTNNNNNSNTHWGHATSTDLINWEEQQIALFPDDLGNMWSGTGVVDHNNTSGFFTNTKDKKGIVVAYSTNTQHIGIAYSLDGGYTFTKVSTNEPVISKPAGVNDFRDPHIFWYEEEEKWVMVVAGGLVRIYESENLVDWTYCSDTSINTECPNLIRMKVEETNEEKWLLSLGGRSYIVGSFDGKEFKKETGELTMNYGPDSYAGITFSDAPNDRVIMISWLNNWAYAAISDGVWNGCFTIPVEFSLHKINNSYQLVQNPVYELDNNRGKRLLSISDKNFQSNENILENIESNTFELNLEVNLTHTNNFELDFCIGDNDKTVVKFNKDTYRLLFIRSDSKYGFDALKKQNYLYNIPISKTSCEKDILKLRIYVDVGNVEIFVNDGLYYFVARIQPFTSSKKMSLTYDENISIKKLEIFEMKSIYFDEDEKVMAPHIGSSSDINLLIDEEYFVDVYAFNKNCYAPIKVRSLDDKIVSAELIDNQLKVKAISHGETEIMIICGKYYFTIKCFVIDETKDTLNSTINNFTVVNGRIIEKYNHYLFESNGGDSFAISDVLCKDFTYEADITVLGSGAGALIFKANSSLSSFYCMNIDVATGVLKLWKKVDGAVFEVTTFGLNLKINRTYNLKVVVIENNIKVYFEQEEVISVVDASIIEGYLGLNVWNTNAKFNNIIFTKNGE